MQLTYQRILDFRHYYHQMHRRRDRSVEKADFEVYGVLVQISKLINNLTNQFRNSISNLL